MSIRSAVFVPGSAGCQLAVFGSLPKALGWNSRRAMNYRLAACAPRT